LKKKLGKKKKNEEKKRQKEINHDVKSITTERKKVLRKGMCQEFMF